MGTGRFVAPKTLEVRLNEGGMRVLAGDRVFLDVGTHATIPDILDLAAAVPSRTSRRRARSRPAPSHRAGWRVCRARARQAYRRFGSRVTLVERAAQLAGREMPTSATRSRECSVTKVSTYSLPLRHCVSRGAR